MIPKRLFQPSRWLFTLFFCGLAQAGTAQSGAGTPFWDKVRYGGGVGLSFGRDAVQIGLSPSAIYQANAVVAFGVGLNFTYARIEDTRLTAYGGSLIGLVNPVPALQVSAEFEQLAVRRDFGPVRDSYGLPALYLGLGYRSGPVTFGVRYDVLYQEDKSLFAAAWMPFVRVYF